MRVKIRIPIPEQLKRQQELGTVHRARIGFTAGAEVFRVLIAGLLPHRSLPSTAAPQW